MTELGQLEGQWQEFEKRKVQIVAISVEDREKAKATQTEYPHLLVVYDDEKMVAEALNVVHPHSAPDGGDSAAPTTILVDSHGVVRWLFRPARFLTRLQPSEVLEAIDQKMPLE
jgi:peroxiredoxin